MTYNFDPERWYEIERSAIETLHQGGEISLPEYEDALDDLERRYADMLDRLDGTYQLPTPDQKD